MATVGLNFTAWALAAARSGALDAAARRAHADSLAAAAAALYAGCWAVFLQRWERGRATMRESGFVLQRLQRECAARPGRLLTAGAAAAAAAAAASPLSGGAPRHFRPL